MSDNTPPNDSDHSLARKRLARELRILIYVHIGALCVATLFFVGSGCVPNYRTWDEIHLLCRFLALSGIIVFFVAPFWGFGKIIYAGFISDMMLTHCLGAWALLIAFFLLSPVGGCPDFLCNVLLLFFALLHHSAVFHCSLVGKASGRGYNDGGGGQLTGLTFQRFSCPN